VATFLLQQSVTTVFARPIARPCFFSTQAGLADVTASAPLTDIELERQDNMNRNRAMLQVGVE
jgi:hypothetical protein